MCMDVQISVCMDVCTGARVEHPSRGSGKVIEVLANDARNKPYRVRFDNGEVPR